MSSKKYPELNSSSIEWFVCKLPCSACLAFSPSTSSSKGMKSSSSSNLSTTNSKSSSSSSSSSTDFSRRDFSSYFFFSCSASLISLILFHSTSRSWMSCNNSMNCYNSTDIKRRFFVISLTCLILAFPTFRAATPFVCISSRFIRQIFIKLSINPLFSIIFLFLQLCDDSQLRILFSEPQITCFRA